jgi:hypothetical protein
MSWIDEVEEAQAEGHLADIYKDLVEKRGKVSNILKVHSLNPDAQSPRPVHDAHVREIGPEPR